MKQAGDAADADGANAHERQRGGLRAEPGHDRAARRALQRQQRAVLERGQPHAGGQRRRDVGEVVLLAAGVHDEEQPVPGQPRDHQVVEDAAGLVGQQAVALAARLEPDDVARHQPFQRRGGVGALQAGLAHMGDVEQRRLARGSAGARR